MSLGDLSRMGRSILKSSLLPPAVSREWMKPVSHMDSLRSAVGRPWEIYRVDVPVSANTSTTRIVDLYTKNGGLGTYVSYLILSPDHGLGISILASEDAPSLTPHALAEMMMARWVPAVEAAAREHAEEVYVGKYASVDGTNSSITIGLRPGRRMLALTSSVSNGTEQLPQLPSANPLLVDLQYMSLKVDNMVSFRLIRQAPGLATSESAVIVTGCGAWSLVDSSRYGNIGLDEIWFHLSTDGKATDASIPATRETPWRKVA